MTDLLLRKHTTHIILTSYDMYDTYEAQIKVNKKAVNKNTIARYNVSCLTFLRITYRYLAAQVKQQRCTNNEKKCKAGFVNVDYFSKGPYIYSHSG